MVVSEMSIVEAGRQAGQAVICQVKISSTLISPFVQKFNCFVES
jgi:hypothetical protein